MKMKTKPIDEKRTVKKFKTSGKINKQMVKCFKDTKKRLK
jgi:hypothetical protein